MEKKHIRVYGQVQGVGFRYHAYTMASQLGIRGWVRNLGDGSVEIQAEGSVDAMTQFMKAVNRGPYHARVDEMVVKELADSGDFRGFDIR